MLRQALYFELVSSPQCFQTVLVDVAFVVFFCRPLLVEHREKTCGQMLEQCTQKSDTLFDEKGKVDTRSPSNNEQKLGSHIFAKNRAE